MSMITATAWVPRGHAKAFPTKYVFDEDEYARISKLAKLELDDAKEDLENARQALANPNAGPRVAASIDGAEESSDDEAQNGGKDSGDEADEDDDLKEYDMEHYDDEPDGMQEVEGEQGPNDSIFGNIKGLAYYTDNKDDPYITLPEGGEMSDDEEREELQIFPTDNLVLAARIEDEVAHLETYVYEDSADNLYVHHDVMLPAIPLCVEWVSSTPNKAGEAGNFAAVGTMDPDIEIWDLDVVDGMYPTAILGQSQPAMETPADLAAKKKKKKKSKKVNDSYHVDSATSPSPSPAASTSTSSAAKCPATPTSPPSSTPPAPSAPSTPATSSSSTANKGWSTSPPSPQTRSRPTTSASSTTWTPTPSPPASTTRRSSSGRCIPLRPRSW